MIEGEITLAVLYVKYKTRAQNISNLRKHLVKHKVFHKPELCTIINSLISKATTSAFSTVSGSSQAGSNMKQLQHHLHLLKVNKYKNYARQDFSNLWGIVHNDTTMQ